MEAAGQSAGGASTGAWRPTEREKLAYAHMLSLVDIKNEGVVRGQQAVPFFQKSGLPDAMLGNIWQLADVDGKGVLTAHEFSVAMKLIALAQSHRPVALANLSDETQLPEMSGVDVSHLFGGNGTHVRRDSSASSVGWGSVLNGGNTEDGSATVSAKELQQYRMIFEKSQSPDGTISGSAARGLFVKTRLSGEQLSRIWQLGDPNQEGKLRLPGFIVCMYYIRRLMENRKYVLPDTCPASLLRSAGGEVPLQAAMSGSFSQSSLLGGNGIGGSSVDLATPLSGAAHWDVTKEERVRYGQFFDSLDTQRLGYLSGDVPVDFFLKSKLPEVALSKIWDLADISHNGKLNRDEFAVAMHLINLRLANGQIPDTLPATLVPPSMRKASIASNSLSSLSPPLRPASARDRLQGIEGVKRTGSYAVQHGRAPMPGPISRASTGRSPVQMSPVVDDGEIGALQAQLGQMEDLSRGMQAQRTATASQIALVASRKQDLEVKIAALQSSQDAEARINQELQQTLKNEESRVSALQAQVAEANRVLSVVSAQRSQLEQDVHRVQTQQLALQQKLGQAQDDARQLAGEIATLDQQKKALEQNVAAMQAQILRLEEDNRAAGQRVESLKGDIAQLTQTSAQLSQTSAALSQASAMALTQGTSTLESEALSFDDVFGMGESAITGESLPAVSEAASVSVSKPAPVPLAVSTEQPQHSQAATGSLSSQQQMSPSLVFATMPGFSSSSAAPGTQVSTTDAFDSFGAHEADPFEEFLHSTTSPVKDGSLSPTSKSVNKAFSSTADPRSVSSTPAPSSSMFSGPGLGTAAATATAAARAAPMLASAGPTAVGARSTPTSPAIDATAGKQDMNFMADFNSAFGKLPGTGKQEIKQELREFEAKFPELGSLSLADMNSSAGTGAGATTTTATTAATTVQAKEKDRTLGDEDDLTFESVFGDSNQNVARASSETGAVGSVAVDRSDSAEKSTEASVDKSEDGNDDDDFVPPPVVKRTNGMQA
ncbi:hypothetical protein GGI07_004903 [Coemansia sp. Benny D115]|nr:hypothetical protein GGI07_004903 [Coemansia sp. Benny D115]